MTSICFELLDCILNFLLLLIYCLYLIDKHHSYFWIVLPASARTAFDFYSRVLAVPFMIFRYTVHWFWIVTFESSGESSEVGISGSKQKLWPFQSKIWIQLFKERDKRRILCLTILCFQVPVNYNISNLYDLSINLSDENRMFSIIVRKEEEKWKGIEHPSTSFILIPYNNQNNSNNSDNDNNINTALIPN